MNFYLRKLLFSSALIQLSSTKKAVKDQKRRLSKSWKISNNKKLNSEMVKLHQHVPLDRQVQCFRTYFY